VPLGFSLDDLEKLSNRHVGIYVSLDNWRTCSYIIQSDPVTNLSRQYLTVDLGIKQPEQFSFEFTAEREQ